MKNAFLTLPCAAVFTLAGCAAAPDWIKPEVEEQKIVRIHELVFSMECELGEAVAAAPARYTAFANQGNATATLTLTVVEAPTISGGITLGIPVGVASIAIASNGKTGFTAKRTMDFKVGLKPQSPAECSAKSAKPGGPQRIESGLGMKEWAIALIDLIDKQGISPTEAGYTTSFQVTNTPGGSLTFTNTGSGRSGGTISAAKSEKYDFTHTVVLALKPLFTPNAPAAARARVVSPAASEAVDTLILRESIRQIDE